MPKIVILIFLSFYSLAWSVDTSNIEGLYAGYVVFNESKEKFPVFLHLNANVREDQNKSELMAFLKIKLGGFNTHEYTTYYFQVKNYDFSRKEIVLDSNSSGIGNGVTLWDGRFSDDWQIIKGKLRSLHGGFVNGELALAKFNDLEEMSDKLSGIYPDLPVVLPITGEYEAGSTVLQLEAMRVLEPYRDRATPFPGTRITGRMASYHRVLKRIAVTRRFDQLMFNPFTQRSQILSYTRQIILKQKMGSLKMIKSKVYITVTYILRAEIFINLFL